MKENLVSFNEVFKGADLDGSRLLVSLITAGFFFWSGSTVILFIHTYQSAYESYSLDSSFPNLVL